MSGDYFLIVLANGQAITAAAPKASSRVLFTSPQDPLDRAQHWKFEGGYIVSKIDGTVFDVYNGLNSPKSPVGLYGKKVAPANITNQQFTLTPEGYLQADSNKASGLVLSVNANSKVEIDTKTGTVNQIFKKVAAPPDVTTTFKNSTDAVATVYWKHNGETLILTIPAGGSSSYVSAQGSEFFAKDPSGAILQPTEIVADKDATVTLKPHIDPLSGYFLLVLDNGLAVTASGGSALTGQPKDLLDPRQYWKVEGTYIVNKADPTKVIDLLNVKTTPGSPVGVWTRNNGANQAWTFGPDGIYSKVAGPDLVLTIDANKNVVIGKKGDKPNQDFKIIPGLPDVKTTFENKTTAVATVYLVHNGETQVLTIPAGGSASYTSLQGSEFVAKDPSGAILKPNKIVADKEATVTLQPAADVLDGYFLLVLDNGLAVTASGGSALTGEPKDLLDHRQYWKFEGTYLVNKADPTKVIDLLNNKTAPGSPVGVWPRNGGSNQAWTLGPEGIHSKLTGPDLVLTIDANKKVVIGKKGDKPNQDFKPIAGLPDVKTTFENKTNAVATVYWVHNGEKQVLTIPAGGSASYVSAKGAEFVAKSPNGTVLKPNKIVANADATVQLLPGSEAPGSPVLTYHKTSDLEVELSWTAPSGGAVKNYTLVQIAPTGAPDITLPGDKLSYEFTAVAGTTYKFKVYATNTDDLKGKDSNTVTVTVESPPPPPVVSHTQKDANTVVISWAYPADYPIAIKEWNLVFTEPLPSETKEFPANVRSFEFTPKKNVEYEFYVTAETDQGVNSVRSNVDNFILKEEQPAIPVLSYKWLSIDRVHLEWTPDLLGGDSITYTLTQTAPKTKVREVGAELFYEMNLSVPGDYTFFVTAKNGAGSSDSEPITITVPLPSEVPQAPVLSYSRVDDKVTSLQLSWFVPKPATAAASAKVVLAAAAAPATSTAGIKEFVVTQHTPAKKETVVVPSSNSFNIELPEDTRATFSVSARTLSGAPGPSSNTIQILASSASPSRPAITYSQTGNNVTVAWASDPNGASALTTYYLVQVAPTYEVKTFSEPTHTYTFTPTSDVTYQFYVVAENADGDQSPRSDTISFAVHSAVAPGAPVLSYTLSGTTARLTWTTPSDGGSPLQGYTLQQTSPTAQTYNVGLVNSYNVNLTPGKTYTFTVKARNSVPLDGPFSNTVTITVPVPITRPNPPVLTLSGPNANGQIVLSWTTPANNGAPIIGYTLYQTAPNYQKFPLTTNTFQLVTPVAGKAYAFYVTATNSAGESAQSNIVCYTAPKPKRWQLYGFTKYNIALNISIEWCFGISIVNNQPIILMPPEGRSWFRYHQNGVPQQVNYLDNGTFTLSGNVLTFRTAVSNNVLSGTLTNDRWYGSAQRIGADTTFNFARIEY